MPYQDGTGPLGQGPKTGRALGNCNQTDEQNSAGAVACGRGRGMGRACGRGTGRGMDRGMGQGAV